MFNIFHIKLYPVTQKRKTCSHSYPIILPLFSVQFPAFFSFSAGNAEDFSDQIALEHLVSNIIRAMEVGIIQEL